MRKNLRIFACKIAGQREQPKLETSEARRKPASKGKKIGLFVGVILLALCVHIRLFAILQSEQKICHEYAQQHKAKECERISAINNGKRIRNHEVRLNADNPLPIGLVQIVKTSTCGLQAYDRPRSNANLHRLNNVPERAEVREFACEYELRVEQMNGKCKDLINPRNFLTLAPSQYLCRSSAKKIRQQFTDRINKLR